MGLMMTEALVKAFAAFTSFWAQNGHPEDRDTCESFGGFHFILGATWASWIRDLCGNKRFLKQFFGV